MAASRKFDVVIAGAGPAGLATALFLMKDRPSLAGRIVAIEKSAHPRFKVCAGGLIPKTMLALDELGIPLDVPAVEVIRGEAATPVGGVDLSRDGDVLATVIRRDLFDSMLARAATAQVSKSSNAVAYSTSHKMRAACESPQTAVSSKPKSSSALMGPAAGCVARCSALARRLSGAR